LVNFSKLTILATFGKELVHPSDRPLLQHYVHETAHRVDLSVTTDTFVSVCDLFGDDFDRICGSSFTYCFVVERLLLYNF